MAGVRNGLADDRLKVVCQKRGAAPAQTGIETRLACAATPESTSPGRLVADRGAFRNGTGGQTSLNSPSTVSSASGEPDDEPPERAPAGSPAGSPVPSPSPDSPSVDPFDPASDAAAW
jgi:hypothetical protein